VAHHDAVEPAHPARPSGDGAELVAAVSDPVGQFPGDFGGEGAVADAGGVRFGDADDLADLGRAHTGAGADAPGRRTGTRDIRIGAVIDVQHDALGAFEQHLPAAVDGV